MKLATAPDHLPVHQFEDEAAFDRWLAQHHLSAQGCWVQVARAKSAFTSITWEGIVDVSLCWGWIDGQRRSHDEVSFLQRVTPRRAKSIWSKVNREKVARLTAAGRMQPTGLAQVSLAQADGRWDAAYDSVSGLTTPPELEAALADNPAAAALFATLSKSNRYSMCWRIQTAKRAETKAKHAAKFVEMLARGEVPTFGG
jgi:uncharacterized protein YdeI (YjbR/CyaY-like superfamily)